MGTERLDKARIKVIGVGGAGCNAVDRMIQIGIPGVSFIAANTDAQALLQSEAPCKIRLGPGLTHGLGAGGDPEIGRRAAQESQRLLSEIVQDAEMIFITGGMGGGTGTGAAPVIAHLAREAHALVIGIVTKPFLFEGPRRLAAAQEGIAQLQEEVDALIVVANERLLEVVNHRLPLGIAFRVADEVLRQGVQGVTELVTHPGLINLDFADVKSVISNAGRTLMSIGHAEGKDKALEAARVALENPLMDIETVQEAEGLLVNFSGGEDLTLAEVSEAMDTLAQTAKPDAPIFFGVTIDPELRGRVQITLIATGLKEQSASPTARHAAVTSARRHTLAELLGDFHFAEPAAASASLRPEAVRVG
ncbi:MAG TPA: cell division protein FtsZ [Anaerolineae bacterium]|nr:cell division protein FtsZ [Anaerolineae bacterium]